MRLVIDLQGGQSRAHGRRGIGRYTRALVEAIIRQAEGDEIVLLVNGMLRDGSRTFRAWLGRLPPHVETRYWTGAPASAPSGDPLQREANAAIRAAVVAELRPDMVLVSNHFEGWNEDAVTEAVGVPTAIVLHDLLPSIHRDAYLRDPAHAAWYDAHAEAVKEADLLLAISDATARDAADHLGLAPAKIVTIGADVDAMFTPGIVTAADSAELVRRYGIARPFLLSTGGANPRKNMLALVEAFAALPREVVAAHQLVIICGLDDRERAQLEGAASKAGLSSNALVLTGAVSDQRLLTLYRACRAFVFPSWHEGFGMPILEAMRCGAAVIGSNSSSVPEVIARPDALFDPHSRKDMAASIERVLTDEPFRAALRENARERSALFSWDETARRALAAMRAKAQEARPLAPAPSHKPRMAYVSPYPPERSGISFHSEALLPDLARHYEIDLVVADPSAIAVPGDAPFGVSDVETFRARADRYERVVYQFGNSAFHAHMFDLLVEIPGAVVLHDVFLSGIEAHLGRLEFLRRLAIDHGYEAVRKGLTQDPGNEDAIWSYPTNGRVVRSAQGVVVHSAHARAVMESHFGPGCTSGWVEIPLLRPQVELHPARRARARGALGVSDDMFLICCFGHISATKLPERVLEGFLCSETSARPDARLVFVGEDHIGGRIQKRMARERNRARVAVTGWADAQLYDAYLDACDIAIQLRTSSRGESSAAVLDTLNHAVPTIVNAHGSLADLDPRTVLRIPEPPTVASVAKAIDRLAMNPALRTEIGAAARAVITAAHAPRRYAELLHDAVEHFHQARIEGRERLLGHLARLPPEAARDERLTQAVADTFPPSYRKRQLLVDVTALAQTDLRTGIQRVVRAILHEWLTHAPEGWRIEPVRLDPMLGRYRYARIYTCDYLGIFADWAEDAPISYCAGDSFLGLDLHFCIPGLKAEIQNMAGMGVDMAFVIYDLLPHHSPQHFPVSSAPLFREWLDTIASSDRLVAISSAVADDLGAYYADRGLVGDEVPDLHWFHLGADIEASRPTMDLPSDLEARLGGLTSRPSFLMVGTIEPRKGHGLVLDAFERLWAGGVEANLVIVGKPGWEVKPLMARLDRHPERGLRLHLLEDVSDAFLQRLYDRCDCLIAASEGEGFGLPLIEAAKHDLPILARDIPVFREVAGEHADYFGGDPDRLTHAVEGWLARRAAGQVRTSGSMPHLTWRQSAQALLRALGIDPGREGGSDSAAS